MNPAKPVMRAVDRYQQRHRGIAFPLAVWKKFGDDQAGSQAALIAYYAFVSIFPLLLVLTAILGIVLRNNDSLRHKIINDAVSDFPSLGSTLASSTASLVPASATRAITAATARVPSRSRAPREDRGKRRELRRTPSATRVSTWLGTGAARAGITAARSV